MEKLYLKTSLGYLVNNSIIYSEIINKKINVTCLAQNTNRDINKIQIIVKIPDREPKTLVNTKEYSILNYYNFKNKNREINDVRGFIEKELNELLKTKFDSLNNQNKIIYSLYKLGFCKIYCGTNKLREHIFLDVKYGKNVLQYVSNRILGASDIICINNISSQLNHNTSNYESKARESVKAILNKLNPIFYNRIIHVYENLDYVISRLGYLYTGSGSNRITPIKITLYDIREYINNLVHDNKINNIDYTNYPRLVCIILESFNLPLHTNAAIYMRIYINIELYKDFIIFNSSNGPKLASLEIDTNDLAIGMETAISKLNPDGYTNIKYIYGLT
jgi:hypothetical protein